MKSTDKTDNNRFQGDAAKYAGYLETPEGRLRMDLALVNLLEFLGPGKDSLRILDLGCGTGATAVRLASLGFQVTLLDSSPAMLDLALPAVQEAGIEEKVTFKLGDAARLADVFTTELFDVILCHNLLEYVEHHDAVLCGATRVMRNSSAILSVLARNQAGEVLKTALQTGDLVTAEHNLSASWARESLYGGKVHLFEPEEMEKMLKRASLTLIAQRGVRVIADYLPPQISRSEQYDEILALERKLGMRSEFAAVARYTHYMARHTTL